MKMKKILVLDNIRSVYNVGSIFRTADAFGISKIFLVGTTPAPKDRFGRKRKDLAKVALGAEESVLWEQCEDGIELIKKLKNDGFFVMSLEQNKNSKNYHQARAKNKTAVVVGNEVGGIDEGIWKISDEIFEIPMKGKKESLNVSVAIGIFLAKLVEIKEQG